MSTDDNVESKSWFLATIIMAMLALVIFFVQHFIVQIFDLTVEISVFYVPAIVLVAVYIKRYSSKSRS